jgi:mannose-6-phosphate isomerase-like protein (cupin superfamily)
MSAVGRVEVRDATRGPELALTEGGGRAWAVVWPGMGAQLRSLHRISLRGGARTVELDHATEAVYYVLSGTGDAVDVDASSAEVLVEGSMAHIEAGTRYSFRAGTGGIELVGGPSPADPALYATPESQS